MPQISNTRLPIASGLLVIVLTLGCGGGAVPDVPAELTADQEQEILQQVEQAASGEPGGSS